MLAKKTSNKIALPETVLTRFAGIDYFDVTADEKCIVLRPAQMSHADEVRMRLEQHGISEQDVAAAICWARRADD
jgi:hypothetical protein